MKKRKDPNVYPRGLSASKVKAIADYYDRQTEEESAHEIEAATLNQPTAWVEIPLDLLPQVRKLLSRKRRPA